MGLEKTPDCVLLQHPCGWHTGRFCLGTCTFPVLKYFRQRTLNDFPDSLFQEVADQPLWRCHGFSLYSLEDTKQKTCGEAQGVFI